MKVSKGSDRGRQWAPLLSPGQLLYGRRGSNHRLRTCGSVLINRHAGRDPEMSELPSNSDRNGHLRGIRTTNNERRHGRKTVASLFASHQSLAAFFLQASESTSQNHGELLRLGMALLQPHWRRRRGRALWTRKGALACSVVPSVNPTAAELRALS